MQAFKKWFGDWELTANIINGINALKELSNGVERVDNAMRRSELKDLGGPAEIAFEWGGEGIPDKQGYIRKGYGFAKIIQKHGADDAIRIIGTIANGKMGEPYVVEGGQRVDIISGEYQTTISLYKNVKKVVGFLRAMR